MNALSEIRTLLETPRMRYALERRPLLRALLMYELDTCRFDLSSLQVYQLARICAELENVADDFGPDGPAGGVVSAMVRSSGMLLNSVEHYLKVAEPSPDLRGLAMAYERALKTTRAVGDAFPEVWNASYEDIAALAEACARLEHLEIHEIVIARLPENKFRVEIEPLGSSETRERGLIQIEGERHNFVDALVSAARAAAEKWNDQDDDDT